MKLFKKLSLISLFILTIFTLSSCQFLIDLASKTAETIEHITKETVEYNENSNHQMIKRATSSVGFVINTTKSTQKQIIRGSTGFIYRILKDNQVVSGYVSSGKVTVYICTTNQFFIDYEETDKVIFSTVEDEQTFTLTYIGKVAAANLILFKCDIDLDISKLEFYNFDILSDFNSFNFYYNLTQDQVFSVSYRMETNPDKPIAKAINYGRINSVGHGFIYADTAINYLGLGGMLFHASTGNFLGICSSIYSYAMEEKIEVVPLENVISFMTNDLLSANILEIEKSSSKAINKFFPFLDYKLVDINQNGEYSRRIVSATSSKTAYLFKHFPGLVITDINNLPLIDPTLTLNALEISENEVLENFIFPIDSPILDKKQSDKVKITSINELIYYLLIIKAVSSFSYEVINTVTKVKTLKTCVIA